MHLHEVKPAPGVSIEMETIQEQISSILKSFEFFNGEYQREAMSSAVELREQIIPELLSVLEDVARNPRKYIEHDPLYESHIYASVLLSHFEEPKAHDLFLRVFGFPGEISSDLFEDLTTEDLPAFLYRTCAGNTDGIRALILDKHAYIYSRVSAAEALVYCVAGGKAERKEVLDFFSGLFTGSEAKDDDGEFWSFIVSSMLDLYPSEYLDLIQSVFQNGMIIEGIIDRDFFNRQIKISSIDSSLEKIRNEMKKRMPEDIHKNMEWWACFQKQNESRNWEEEEDLELYANPLGSEPKIGRNDPCPCDSGKKYKKCCLQ